MKSQINDFDLYQGGPIERHIGLHLEHDAKFNVNQKDRFSEHHVCLELSTGEKGNFIAQERKTFVSRLMDTAASKEEDFRLKAVSRKSSRLMTARQWQWHGRRLRGMGAVPQNLRWGTAHASVSPSEIFRR